MISLLFNGTTITLRPNAYERWARAHGAPTETRGDVGIIEENWEHQRGGVFWYFLMSWELATQEEVNVLRDFLVANPTPSNPMVLVWEDGTKYQVIFADEAGEDRCKFDESIRDYKTGIRFYKGTVALIEIEKLEV